MKKAVGFHVFIFYFGFSCLYAQSWNLPMNIIESNSGIGGRLGSFCKLLVVNGNPAMAAWDATRGNLYYIRANDAAGTSWGVPISIDVTSDVVGGHISFQIVNAVPAISYFDFSNGDLKFIYGSDANGTAWASPVLVDVAGVVGQYSSLQIVNGVPAISYYDYTNGNLKYVRATDVTGSAWGEPITIESIGIVGQFSSLVIVNNFPAISYYDSTGGDLKYVRATDVSGTGWEASIKLDGITNVGQYTSMQIVNGFPAISYYDGGSNNDLKYVRATDASGTTWASPIKVRDAASSNGGWTSMEIVNGFPAISYNGIGTFGALNYVRATDTDGTAWAATVIVEDLTNGALYTSLQIVNGNPAIAYYDLTQRDLKYVRASDPSGAVWPSPVSFDVTDVGPHNALQIVNGKPAICYYTSESFYIPGVLKYIPATNTSGIAWSAPVNAAGGFSGSNVGWNPCLQIVNGFPAISCYDVANGNLEYVRAADVNGTTWGSPLWVATTGDVGETSSLQIVNGFPAISYYDLTNGNLKYVRATDANGGVWATPVSVDIPGDVGRNSCLRIINGNPAIAYLSGTGLKYVRANDINGVTWGTPVTIDNIGAFTYTSISINIVNNNPAISYTGGNAGLKYVRATNVNGNTWDTPVFADASGDVGRNSCLQIVDGYPAISSYDIGNGNLKYVRALDVDGTAWNTPVSLDTTGDVGQYNSMQVINGKPAISYYDATNHLLRFISSVDFDLPTKVSLCPFGNGSLTSSITGAAYQWQVNTGSGFVNISDDANYSGTNTGNLQLSNIPSSWYGYQYQCVVDGNNSYSYSLKFFSIWTGSVNTSWENSSNWDCGVVPDPYTDAIINIGTVNLNSNTGCRSLTVKPGVTLTIGSGFNLTVTH